MQFQELANFIWSVADLLRGDLEAELPQHLVRLQHALPVHVRYRDLRRPGGNVDGDHLTLGHRGVRAGRLLGDGALALLFQQGAMLNSISVAENVAMPLIEHTKLPKDVVREIVKLKLDLVGLHPPVYHGAHPAIPYRQGFRPLIGRLVVP